MTAVKKKNIKDLLKKVSQIWLNLEKDRFNPTNQSKDSFSRRKKRKEIAKLLTEINSKKDKK